LWKWKELPCGSGHTFVSDDVALCHTWQWGQSVSAPLQSGIRFFHVPISAPRIGSPCGLLTTSEEAERYGLTTFRVSDCDGLGPSYSPAVLMSVWPHLDRRSADCTPFWFKPQTSLRGEKSTTSLGLFFVTMFIRRSH